MVISKKERKKEIIEFGTFQVGVLSIGELGEFSAIPKMIIKKKRKKKGFFHVETSKYVNSHV